MEIPEEERNDLKLLLLYSSEIYEIYGELADFPNDAAKLSEKLKELQKKEEQIYKKYANNLVKLNYMVRYLGMDFSLKDYIEQIREDNSLIIERVHNRFYEMYLQYFMNNIKKTSDFTSCGLIIYEKYVDFSIELELTKIIIETINKQIGCLEDEELCQKLRHLKYLFQAFYSELDNNSKESLNSQLAKKINDSDWKMSSRGIMDLLINRYVSLLGKTNPVWLQKLGQIIIKSASEFYDELEIIELMQIASYNLSSELSKKLQDILREKLQDSKENLDISENVLFLLNKLSLISEKIYQVYEELALLEINGQKDSLEYLEKINELKNLLKYENVLYQKIGFSPKVASDILVFLIGYKDYTLLNCLQDIEFNRRSNIIVNRMAEHFNLIVETCSFEEEIANDKDGLDLFEDECFGELQEMLDGVSYEEEEEKFLHNFLVDNAILNDLKSTILYLLNESISQNSKEVQEFLIRMKYLMFFSFSSLEKGLIARNFQLPEFLYWYALACCKNLQKDYYVSYYLDSKNVIANDILNPQFIELFNFTNANLEEVDNYSISVMISVILRSCLLFLEKENQKVIIERMKQEIYSIENLDPKLKEIFDRVWILLEDDERKPAILSLS